VVGEEALEAAGVHVESHLATEPADAEPPPHPAKKTKR
jgi:hypothetical protein